MRRLIAAVALIVTMWPHIAVMQCAGPSSAPLSFSASMQHEHEHGGGACRALMICAAAMIESGSTSALRAAPGAEVSPVTPRPLPPVVPVLTDEPPPPRRSA
jgi:hypothetical protein